MLKTESLGIGSYGAVCKAMCDDLPCAAKVLHPALFQFTTPGSISVVQKFEQECRLLSAIKHPNIVLYLGTYRDPDSKLPVLLMELMDESLTQFLERSHEPLPYHTEVNLCHDIALALSYLHSNGIIHRDLSSNNVLLIAGSRAKVTDFGMVKLYNVNHSTANLTPLTMCPGTVVYMSPEALGEPPVYTEMLDSFSFGVLCIQIMTRQFPYPGNRFNTIEINDPRAPSGRVQVVVPEIERRQSHINLIGPSHPLLPVALSCLKDSDRERPSCHELCGRISRLKAFSKYTESVQQSAKPTQSANGESRRTEMQQSQNFHDLQQQLHIQRKQLQGKEQEIQQQRQQILELQHLFTATNDQLQTLQQHLTGEDSQLENKEAAIMIAARQQEIQELRKQLQSSEQMTVELQQNLLEKTNTIQHQQRQIRELQQQLRQTGSHRQMEVETSVRAASLGSIKLRWRDGRRAPCGMCGEVVAADGSVAYFRLGDVQSNRVIVYLSAHTKWSELPDCPNYDFSLAIVHSLLIAIGGKTPTNHKVTNSLFSLTDNKWTKQLPPMPTKRCVTAVVCNGRSLVVAGGVGEKDKNLSTVEVMDTETLEWSTASSLPHPLTQASATLCGNQVYMLGGWDQRCEQSKSVFTCSLAALQSCQPQTLGARMKSLSLATRVTVWHKLADTPVTLSTCASLRGQLLAVGGCDSDDKKTTAIHTYNTITNSWEVISHMSTPRYRCLVAVLPHNELMVVGGGTSGGITNSVEIASIV